MSESQNYIVPEKGRYHPRRHFDALIKACPEHAHLKDLKPRVEFLLAVEPVVRAGKQVLGEVHLPKVQGRLRGVFAWMLRRTFGDLPDFLIILDSGYWSEAVDRDREILVYHEMCHCVQAVDRDGEPRFDDDGNPVFALVAHDVEEFDATVRRYGAYSVEVKRFLAAAQAGEGEIEHARKRQSR